MAGLQIPKRKHELELNSKQRIPTYTKNIRTDGLRIKIV